MNTNGRTAARQRSAMPSSSKWTARNGGSIGARPRMNPVVPKVAAIVVATPDQRQDGGPVYLRRHYSDVLMAPVGATTCRSNTPQKCATSAALGISHRDRAPSRPRKRRDAATRDPAGDDELEIIQVGHHVERKAVAGDPARNPDSNRTQLIGADPRARQPLDAPRRQAEICRRRESSPLPDRAHICARRSDRAADP